VKSESIFTKLKRLMNVFSKSTDPVQDNKQSVQDNKQILQDFMWEWMSSPIMCEEILKTLKSDDLCFLHPIRLNYKISDDNTIDYTYLLENKYIRFDENIYYENEIKNCNQNIMVIPIAIFNYKNNIGHQNMVIIKIEQNKIEIELFEPNGSHSFSELKNSKITIDDLYSNINNFITTLIKLKYPTLTIEYITPSDECLFNTNLQRIFAQGHAKYSSSCQYVSMLYALKRVIYPEMTREQIYNDINTILKNKEKEGKLEEFVNQIIYYLIDLLDIDYEKFVIKNKRGEKINYSMKEVFDNIEEYKQKLNTLNEKNKINQINNEILKKYNLLLNEFNSKNAKYNLMRDDIYEKLLDIIFPHKINEKIIINKEIIINEEIIIKTDDINKLNNILNDDDDKNNTSKFEKAFNDYIDEIPVLAQLKNEMDNMKKEIENNLNDLNDLK
jgi:hypothetical protein